MIYASMIIKDIHAEGMIPSDAIDDQDEEDDDHGTPIAFGDASFLFQYTNDRNSRYSPR